MPGKGDMIWASSPLSTFSTQGSVTSKVIICDLATGDLATSVQVSPHMVRFFQSWKVPRLSFDIDKHKVYLKELEHGPLVEGVGICLAWVAKDSTKVWEGRGYPASGPALLLAPHRHPVPGELLCLEQPRRWQVRDLHGCLRVRLPHPALPHRDQPAVETEDLHLCLPEEMDSGE